MQFKVKLFDPDSNAVRESIEQADSAAALTLHYKQTGLVVLSLHETRGATRTKRPVDSGSGALDTAWWCRELRTLLQAGMTVVEALETLKAQSLGPQRQALHDQLVGCLHEGQSLSTAMQATAAFPAVLVAGVKASERTSTLIAALDDYLRYHELLDGLKRKVLSAAIYPCGVFSLGLVITVFLLVFVIPRFSRMYADRQSSIGGTTKVLLWTSQLLTHHAYAFAGAALAFGLVLAWAWRQGLVARAASALLDAIGPLHRQVNEFRMAKLYQSMALMIRGGYAVAETLHQCAELKLHPGMRQKLLQARSELEQGRRVCRGPSADRRRANGEFRPGAADDRAAARGQLFHFHRTHHAHHRAPHAAGGFSARRWRGRDDVHAGVRHRQQHSLVRRRWCPHPMRSDLTSTCAKR